MKALPPPKPAAATAELVNPNSISSLLSRLVMELFASPNQQHSQTVPHWSSSLSPKENHSTWPKPNNTSVSTHITEFAPAAIIIIMSDGGNWLVVVDYGNAGEFNGFNRKE
ncbi:hypothetical protein ACFE04_005721 [Oxalis oulophora]